MPRDLFADPTTDRPAPRTSRLIPISIALHGIVVAAVVVVPLLAVGEPPPVGDQLSVVLVAEPPLPGVELVPAPRPPRRASVQREVTRPPGPQRPAVNITTPDGIARETEIDPGLPEWLPARGRSLGIGELPAGRGNDADSAVKAAAPSGPIRAGGEVERPRKLRHVAPEYPVIALRANVQGVVVIDAVIGPDGYVRETIVRRSDSPLLESAALAAVRQWAYTPTRLNGVPTAVIMSVEVRFTLRR